MKKNQDRNKPTHEEAMINLRNSFKVRYAKNVKNIDILFVGTSIMKNMRQYQDAMQLFHSMETFNFGVGGAFSSEVE